MPGRRRSTRKMPQCRCCCDPSRLRKLTPATDTHGPAGTAGGKDVTESRFNEILALLQQPVVNAAALATRVPDDWDPAVANAAKNTLTCTCCGNIKTDLKVVAAAAVAGTGAAAFLCYCQTACEPIRVLVLLNRVHVHHLELQQLRLQRVARPQPHACRFLPYTMPSRGAPGGPGGRRGGSRGGRGSKPQRGSRSIPTEEEVLARNAGPGVEEVVGQDGGVFWTQGTEGWLLLGGGNPNRDGAAIEHRGPSRREREAMEKAKQAALMQKLQAEGKTSRAKADLARLAEVRKRREEAERARSGTSS
ncbi:28 kda heat- and acid-stable phosphoprotein [Cyclospora cayetanensis]|uniref:28 kDa heat-and acid-stable phosphoprotein n=1 Tax=Cyclospora cayetanensis TaxID=88456 RepID=A0A1D3D2V5_9EIME|nr:28 kda heat- and acid-stable phosphoprotein [Cyclospora cayetanensis]